MIFPLTVSWLRLRRRRSVPEIGKPTGLETANHGSI
jgi:hypothetical protein